MLKIERLSIEDARILIDGATIKSNDMGIPMCIAVTDEAGDLILEQQALLLEILERRVVHRLDKETSGCLVVAKNDDTHLALSAQFARRGVKPIAVSVDPLESHLQWVVDIEATQGVALNFPLIADEDRTVSNLYGMIHPNASDTMTVRWSARVLGPTMNIAPVLSGGKVFLANGSTIGTGASYTIGAIKMPFIPKHASMIRKANKISQAAA